METGETQKLSYAPPGSKKHEIPRNQIALVLLFLLALLLMLQWRSVRSFYFTSQSYVWQRRALAAQPEPNHPAYVEDQDEAKRLANIDPRYVISAANGGAMYFDPAWEQMRRWASMETQAPPERDGATVLSHRRKSPHGEERLMLLELVSFAAQGVDGQRSVILYGRSIATGTLGRSWHYAYLPPPSRLRDKIAIRLNSDDRLKVYSAQADAADESHFTVRLELSGREHVLDGHLRDDDHIELVPREGRVESEDGIPTWKP